MKNKITLAGATGWAGSVLAKAIINSEDLELVAAVSRKSAGKNLSEIFGLDIDCPIFSSAEEALKIPSDIFFEYTKPESAKSNIVKALISGRHVVVGTSGLTNEDYEEIDQAANKAQKGVLAVGNFALTVVLLQKFAEITAKYIDHWEIIDYASDSKADVPSGTVRELAHRLSKVKSAKMTIPLTSINGVKEARGGNLSGSQVHSIRLPGYVIGAETIFGMKDQKLIMRHEAGSSAEPATLAFLIL